MIDIITIGLFITSEILPYIKNYFTSLKASDINSISQLIYYSGWSVATCLYYVCSGNWSKEQKRRKLLKKAHEIEEILSEEIKAELKKRIEEQEQQEENKDEEEKQEIDMPIEEAKENIKKEISKIKFGKKFKTNNTV